MNDDYLWDKSGHPDPQIQQLEEILGTLGYQPRPLVIPDELRSPQRRNYFPLLAIAASILLAILAGGIWLRVRSRSEAPKQQAQVEEKVVKPNEPLSPPIEKSAVHHPRLASNRRRNKSASPAHKEALKAKEQLLLALRVASQKLHLVHTKTQGTAPANQIKNQHRVG